jgi:hypothetical protein
MDDDYSSFEIINLGCLWSFDPAMELALSLEKLTNEKLLSLHKVMFPSFSFCK